MAKGKKMHQYRLLQNQQKVRHKQGVYDSDLKHTGLNYGQKELKEKWH